MSSTDTRSLATRAVRGTGWVAAGRLSGKLLFFLSTLILARVLEQDDFGVAAYAITLIALIGAVPALGLIPALIVHADDDETLSTGFWAALGAGLAVFGLVWVLAPLTEHLFHDARAIGVTRALAATFPVQALRTVHAALLRRRLAFKRGFLPDLSQSVAKGLTSIALALLGFGYWALILGTLAGALASVAAYWTAVRWIPRPIFAPALARRLVGFGVHVVWVDLMGALIRNVDKLLVGRILGAAALGVYVLAFRIPDLLVRDLCRVLGQVVLPVYAHVRDDERTVRRTFVASLGYVFAITAPIAVGLAVVAEPLVLSLFSEKWAAVVPVIAPVCAYALLASLSYNAGDLFKAVGRPDVLSRIGVLRVVTTLPALWVGATVFGTPAAVAWGQAAAEVVALVANLWVAQRVFRLPVAAALAQTLPVLASALLMGVVAHGVLALGQLGQGWSEPSQLVVASMVGVASYLAALRLLARGFVDQGLGTLAAALGRPGLTRETAR